MKKLLIILFAVTIVSCSTKKRVDDKLFTLMPSSVTGISFNNKLTETEEMNMIEYLYFNNGGGVAAGDINNDGYIDLYFTASQLPNKLYLNRGDFRFEDITGSAGVAGDGDWKTGVTMADVNGDGYLDIYVCQVSDYKGLEGGNQLFINNGNLTFSDSTEAYGLDFKGFSTQSTFFDYDLDGDLDMFLLNHSVHSRRSYGNIELREQYDPKAGDRLYRNNLNENTLGFTEVTQQSGIYSSVIGYGLNVSVSDINEDGYPDIYISNDFHENDYLYMNNGDGTFTDRFIEKMAHSSRSSMGNDIADINNDGRPDIIVLDMLPEKESIRHRAGGEDDYDVFEIKRKYGYYYQFVRNTLQLNLGGGYFSEIGRLAGIDATDWSWSPLLRDLDNDGWKDLFITNGIYRRANDLDYIEFLTSIDRSELNKKNSDIQDEFLYKKMPLEPLINYAWHNNKDLTFSNRSDDWGIDVKSYSNGSTYADLDNDGDLDLIINNINEEAFIYRNNANQVLERNYLDVSLAGPDHNPFGIGARLILYNNGKKQFSENYTVRGFFSSTAPEIHFGLDTLTRVDSLEIYWPGNKKQSIYDIPSNQKIRINIKDAGTSVVSGKNSIGSLFRKTSLSGIDFKHRENQFVDFKYEPLMPHELSSQGPCIAIADINGDHLQDIYIGGARDQPGVMFKQQSSGEFVLHQPDLFQREIFYEDVDAVFFDVDGDGDQDLYVVSGGNENILPDPFMKDRIYVNDGDGNFKRSMDALPEFYHNGSCVRPADFDRDGDLDLFIGSRSIPRAYGFSARSFLLVNDGQGKFKDGTSTHCPELSELGMVTDAAWADMDGDGDEDLIIVGEWMPVIIMKNENNRLANTGNTTVFPNGWWFSVKPTDIDLDGDIDLIVGNLGLNTSLEASVAYPVKLYINDFDRDGSLDQIVTWFREGIEYPFNHADLLFRKIPSLRERFGKYSDFAGKSIHEIFPPEELNNSLIRQAECFETSLFINQGDLKFTRKPLPVEIQFSPVNDFIVKDFNNDQNPDIICGGNFYSVIPYFGRYDASYGWYLQGKGNGEFETFLPSESGFVIDGEIRDMELLPLLDDTLIVIGLNDKPLQYLTAH